MKIPDSPRIKFHRELWPLSILVVLSPCLIITHRNVYWPKTLYVFFCIITVFGVSWVSKWKLSPERKKKSPISPLFWKSLPFPNVYPKRKKQHKNQNDSVHLRSEGFLNKILTISMFLTIGVPQTTCIPDKIRIIHHDNGHCNGCYCNHITILIITTIIPISDIIIDNGYYITNPHLPWLWCYLTIIPDIT